WMHRFVHAPGIYDRVHRTHHLSTNPSAFAAFAFHPLEAVLEIAVFVVIVMLIPMTLSALILVGLFSLIYNVYGHLGYEIMPRFIAKSPLGYVLNKSAYHNQHHRTYRYNYGLYTAIWDRLFGTLHPHADRLYDEKTRR
ncbi:MAG: sterol desaturase family protein, partial [Pseudomonadota bacterium]